MIKSTLDYSTEISLYDEMAEKGRLTDRLISGECGYQTVNEMSRTKVHSRREDRHVVPNGCQWSRDCELCPWPDCISEDEDFHISYDSDTARAIRQELTNTMRMKNQSPAVIAKFLGVHVNTVYRTTRCDNSTPAERLRMHMRVKQYHKHHPEASRDELAEYYGVHVRTINRILEKEKLLRPL